MICAAGALYAWLSLNAPLVALSLALIAVTTGWVTPRQLRQRRPVAVPLLVWGMYVGLLPFVASQYWVWELGESYPVKPVAALAQAHTPPGDKLLTSDTIRRPSLEFYSDRPVVPAAEQRLRRQWQRGSYLLLDEAALQRPWVDQGQVLGRAAGWAIVAPPTKSAN